MPFKEKSAWIMTLALLLGGILYFAAVAQMSASGDGLAPPTLPGVVVYTAILVIVAIVGHVVVAALGPREADAPADERDRLVVVRASHASSYLLGVGVLLSLGAYLLVPDGRLLFYLVFASLMASQTAEYALQIWYYRRGV